MTTSAAAAAPSAESEPAGIPELRSRRRAVVAALDAAEGSGDVADRDQVRGEIVALVREAEARMEELAAFRESVRELVDRYKRIYRTTTQEVGGSVHVDYLGSSTFLERGWSAIAGADYARAVDALRRALEFAPDNDRAEALLGWALMRLDRLEEAREVLTPLLARAPDHALACANLGYVALREGRYDEALGLLAAAADAPADRTAAIYARLYLGMLHAERGAYGDAYAAFERAIELGPNLVEAYWEMGCAYERAGDLASAADWWRRGAAANRFNPWGERCGEAARRAAGESV